MTVAWQVHCRKIVCVYGNVYGAQAQVYLRNVGSDALKHVRGSEVLRNVARLARVELTCPMSNVARRYQIEVCCCVRFPLRHFRWPPRCNDELVALGCSVWLRATPK